MMSLIDLEDEQRWVPTHVNVTVLCARGLRTKSKHGSRYLYAVVQVGKDKYTTGLVDKADVPVWSEECCFELLPGILEEEVGGGGGRGAYPSGSADLVLTVMHRVLIGLDVFLGQTVIPLDRLFREGACPRDQWFKLHSKAGRKAKERGELQLTVQFTRNNMTASMFDLTAKDGRRSAFGKLKDRVTGRKRPDVESSSAIVPGRYAALSTPPGQSLGDESGGAAHGQDVEATEEKRSVMKDFFKGKLRKLSDTRSCSSLASESSTSSMASDAPGPAPALGLLSDLPSSPIYTTVTRVDPHYGDLTTTVLTSRNAANILTHKRAFSDEARKITESDPRTNPNMESVKCQQSISQSKSSVCINGSHVYDSEPSIPKSAGALPSKLVLLEKCSPLSRSLQNLTKRSEDKGTLAEERRWSFDKMKKDGKEEEKETPPAETRGHPEQAAKPSAADSSDKGWKLRKTLFSAGRSDSVPAKPDSSQAASTSEGRLRGWFSYTDSQNKPRLEVSSKLESTTPPIPPHVSVGTHGSPSTDSLPIDQNHTHPMTPPPTPISPSNPFFEELQRSPLSTHSSSTFLYSSQHSGQGKTSPSPSAASIPSIKRERPRPVARQASLPEFLPETSKRSSSRPMMMSRQDWEDSFDMFASHRLNTPNGNPTHMQLESTLASSQRCSYHEANLNTGYLLQERQRSQEEPPPLPPRRPVRTLTNEIYSDGWLHRGQELAVHKEASLLSQTGVASRQYGRDSECIRPASSVSPDSETSDSRNVKSRLYGIIPSPGFMSEETLKKYEPLEDTEDFWGGMLFEQDLYGRVCRGNVRRATLHVHNNTGLGNVQECETSVVDHLKKSHNSPSMSELKTGRTPALLELTESSTTGMNNNVTFSLTFGDLNMNVSNSNSDFSFMDSDGSSQLEEVDDVKGLSSLSRIGPQLSTDSKTAIYHEPVSHKDANALKDTGKDSSLERTMLSNKTCNQDFPFEANKESIAEANQSDLGIEPREDKKRHDDALKEIKIDCDDNGNPDRELFPRVASARVRPKGISRLNSTDSPSRTDLGQHSSIINEGPSSYQPNKPAASSNLASDSNEDNVSDSNCPLNNRSPIPLNDTFLLLGDDMTQNPSEITFEVLHAKVAPHLRSPRKSKQQCSLTAADLPIPPSCWPITCPSSTGLQSTETSRSLIVAPYTTTSSSTPNSSTVTIDQPAFDAWHSLLTEETRPACNLPHQESRPHPVKPLSQPEKKESRSVLDKLKSTISPARSAQQASVEPPKIQEPTEDRLALYEHLTNMELISLLLQQDMDMNKQQAASERQQAQLEKCEADLKKVKAQVRDLEDYIDNLLLRIMEQTPTLLQVRSRHK
ncbi:rab11 family-interacting protein 1 isoform X1 [Hippocampus zosterae]|uniref:rab11 family-interacting protein 1 isoform X1 n=1 Tax=Hippocampus zosterae TaxID=109293 RepID=UPI00223CCCFE|nr:rab11 family-interacting protein 1 isoform X1 [Hippocampus zosterae]XP_051929142.1 rab11 family-interacting protein 1 isoform X1 [Hippocampus zosterae]